jgi:hypothetical protein
MNAPTQVPSKELDVQPVMWLVFEYARIMDGSGALVGEERAERVRKAHLKDEEIRNAIRSLVASTHEPPAVPPGCKQCPWTVGDTYQRDCGYPDCSPGTAQPPPAVHDTGDGLLIGKPEAIERQNALYQAATSFHETYCPTCPDHRCNLGAALAEINRAALTKGAGWKPPANFEARWKGGVISEKCPKCGRHDPECAGSPCHYSPQGEE